MPARRRPRFLSGTLRRQPDVGNETLLFDRRRIGRCPPHANEPLLTSTFAVEKMLSYSNPRELLKRLQPVDRSLNPVRSLETPHPAR